MIRLSIRSRRRPRRATRATSAAVAALSALVAAALAGPAPASAQEPGDADDAARLPPLEVSVARARAWLETLPHAVRVLDVSDEAADGRATSLRDVLGGVPGVFVQDRRNASLGDRITLRGQGARAQFGVRGIQVLVDGIPLTLPDGQTALANLDLASAGRIEILRGPASALYGNAAGGVIDVRTRIPAARSLVVEPGVTAASHGFVSSRVEASGTSGRVAWLGALRRVETDGFRDHARAETWHANMVGRYTPSPSLETRVVLNVAHAPLAENPSSLDAETARTAPRSVRPAVVAQGLGETYTQGQVGLSLRHRSGTDELTASVWGLGRSVRNPIPSSIIDLSRRAGGARFMFEGRLPLAGRARFAAGVDAALQVDDRKEFDNEGVPEGDDEAAAGALRLDQRERVAGLGPFAQVTFVLGGNWRLTLAGRYDANFFRADDRKLDDGDDSGRRTLDRFSPSAGLAWRVHPDHTAYANFATAFETPTTSELSNHPTGAGGFNPELRPEVLRSVELGGRGRLPANLDYDLALYRATAEDALLPFQGPTEEVFFRNAGRVSRDGLEVSLGWTPGRLGARLSWTWQDFVLEEFATDGGDLSGGREPGVPRHHVSVGLRGDLGRGLRAKVEGRWVDAFPVDDANRFSNPSYRVVDAALSWEGRIAGAGMRPHLEVVNLFDERYNGSVVPNAFGDRYYEPAPGREIVAGVRVLLPAGGRDPAFASAPREP